MIYGKRAQELRKKRGNTPLFVRGLHYKQSARPLSLSALIILCGSCIATGVCATLSIGFYGGYQRVDHSEILVLDTLRKNRIDISALSAKDIETRFLINKDTVEDLNFIFSIPFPQDQEPSLAFATRLEVLRRIISDAAQMRPEEVGKYMDDLRSNITLTARMKELIEALRPINSAEISALAPLLQQIMALPEDKRSVLETAGFPTVPITPELQSIYEDLSHLTHAQALFIHKFLRRPRSAQDVIAILIDAIDYKVISRALGALRDGNPSVRNPVNALPQACDVAVLDSCKLRAHDE